MAIGGFLGSDPILTAAKLEQMVSAGELRYFLTTGMPDFSGFQRPNSTGNAGAMQAAGSPEQENSSSNLTNRMAVMPGMGQTEITDWVEAHGTLVPVSEWSGENTTVDAGMTGFGRQENLFKLYDLRGVNST
jgi:hypothetical protein